MKKITVVSGCFNEEENLEELVQRVFAVAEKFPAYEWDYILIDNCSTDGSEAILRQLAAADRRIKVIFNTRNFGHIRSPFHGMLSRVSGVCEIFETIPSARKAKLAAAANK